MHIRQPVDAPLLPLNHASGNTTAVPRWLERLAGVVATALALTACSAGTSPPTPPALTVAPIASAKPKPTPAVPDTRAVSEPVPAGVLVRLGSRRDRCRPGSGELRYATDGRLLAAEAVNFSHIAIRELDSGRVLYEREGTSGLLTPQGDGWLTLTKPVAVWDLAKDTPRAELTGHWGIHGAFIRNGREVVFGDYGQGEVLSWSPSGGQLRSVAKYKGVLSALAGAAAGGAVALAFPRESRLDVVDGQGGLRSYALPSGTSAQIAFDAAGTFLAVAVADQLLAVDVAAGQLTELATIDTDSDRRRLAVSPDGKVLALSAQKTVMLLNRQGASVASVSLSQAPVALDFAANGLQLAVRDVQGRVLRLDSASGEQQAAPPGHDVNGAAALSPSGKRALTGGGHIYLWDVERGAVIAEAAATERIVTLAFASEGVAVSLSDNGQLLRWSLPQLQATELVPKGYYTPRPGNLSAAAEVGRFLAPAAWKPAIEFAVFDVSGKRLAHYNGPFTAVALDPSGKLAALVNDDEVTVREVDSGRVVGRLPHTSRGYQPSRVALSKQGQLLALCRAGVLTLWRPGNSDVLQQLPGSCDAIAVLDPQHVLAGDSQGRLQLVGATSGLEGTASHQQQGIVAIAPAAQGVLVGSADGTALLYPRNIVLGAAR